MRFHTVILSIFAFSFCMWRWLGILLTTVRSVFVISQNYSAFYHCFVVSSVFVAVYVERTLTPLWCRSAVRSV